MNFTANQITQFFTAANQMGLTPQHRVALQREGLTTIEDFSDFKEKEIKVAIKNVRTGVPPVPGLTEVPPVPGLPAIDPVPEVRDENGELIEAAIPGRAAIPARPGIPAVAPIPGIPAQLVSARSMTRLIIASIAYNYYVDTEREVTPENMHFNNVLRDFHTEWEAIEELSEQDAPKLPSLSKNNPPLKWCESFKHFLYSSFGVRKVPLLYVIRENVGVVPEDGNDLDTVYDPLMPNKAFGSSGSILDDLINRSSHTHPLFKNDNATVFGHIEEASRGSIFATTIKPFSRTKNGRGAWIALITSHVGTDKWERIQKENSAWLISAKWTGKKYALDSFISQHRSKFQQLQEAATHVEFQVPNEHTRVTYLIDSITNSDAALQAAIANIRQNANESRDDFEKASAILLPVDPYSRNAANKKTISFQISALGAADKFGRGQETGVDLRWYKASEYANLKDEQKKELQAWQKSTEGKKAIAKSRKAYFDAKKRTNPDDTNPRPTKSQRRAEKTKAKIASLESELKLLKEEKETKTKESEIATLLTSSHQGQQADKSMSVARQVMAIVARKRT